MFESLPDLPPPPLHHPVYISPGHCSDTPTLASLYPSPLSTLRKQFAVADTPVPLHSQLEEYLMTAISLFPKIYSNPSIPTVSFFHFVIALSLVPIHSTESQAKNTPQSLLSIVLSHKDSHSLSLLDHFTSHTVHALSETAALLDGHDDEQTPEQTLKAIQNKLQTLFEFILLCTQISPSILTALRNCLSSTPSSSFAALTPDISLPSLVTSLLHSCTVAQNTELLQEFISFLCILLAPDFTRTHPFSPSTPDNCSLLSDFHAAGIVRPLLTTLLSATQNYNTDGQVLTLYSAFCLTPFSPLIHPPDSCFFQKAA